MIEKDPLHPIIDAPFNYDIIGFNYQINREDPLKSYIDMTLQKDDVVRRLRFIGPRDLEIEKGFPMATAGMEILDVKSRQMTDINVWVNDFEASQGAVTFWAKSVIDLDKRHEL